MMTGQYAILKDVFELWQAGRKNAAKVQWLSLQNDFRSSVIDYTISVLQEANMDAEVKSCPTITLEGKYGQLDLSPSWIQQMVVCVSEIIHG